jgi:hypothetical protein
MRLILVALGLISTLGDPPTVRAPSGFRFPNEADYSGDWKEFRAKLPTPFVVKADFNGDGLPDEVWLLPMNSGPGFGLFAYLGSQGSHRVIRLETDQKRDAQGFGLAVVEPGQQKRACGKGYWACKRGEPEVLDLKLPAFEFFKFESASSIFWWDGRSGGFRRTQVSD